MTQPTIERRECVAAVIEDDDGWAYSCLCGFESRSGFARRYAEKLARLHETSRNVMIGNSIKIERGGSHG